MNAIVRLHPSRGAETLKAIRGEGGCGVVGPKIVEGVGGCECQGHGDERR
ncbi:hypothetical protein [Methylocella sp.]